MFPEKHDEAIHEIGLFASVQNFRQPIDADRGRVALEGSSASVRRDARLLQYLAA